MLVNTLGELIDALEDIRRKQDSAVAVAFEARLDGRAQMRFAVYSVKYEKWNDCVVISNQEVA